MTTSEKKYNILRTEKQSAGQQKVKSMVWKSNGIGKWGLRYRELGSGEIAFNYHTLQMTRCFQIMVVPSGRALIIIYPLEITIKSHVEIVYHRKYQWHS